MAEEPMTFEDFRQAFFYGRHADLQFEFLARMNDESAADAVAAVLARLAAFKAR